MMYMLWDIEVGVHAMKFNNLVNDETSIYFNLFQRAFIPGMRDTMATILDIQSGKIIHMFTGYELDRNTVQSAPSLFTAVADPGSPMYCSSDPQTHCELNGFTYINNILHSVLSAAFPIPMQVTLRAYNEWHNWTKYAFACAGQLEESKHTAKMCTMFITHLFLFPDVPLEIICVRWPAFLALGDSSPTYPIKPTPVHRLPSTPCIYSLFSRAPSSIPMARLVIACTLQLSRPH
ncbi:Guanine nucleotide-binding protein subunit beta [Ceratobasidium theobromae]|uniref:Guanine nucleotide-binding protein subunit beta n=1 Tax=Ceratobasidium theobromae TaxID=1582974 RepID=A0A5N5QD92_9AGAM|nr:Guanine nucleotide-binding protein subunit beta [Ceratobasidium theobromae]